VVVVANTRCSLVFPRHHVGRSKNNTKERRGTRTVLGVPDGGEMMNHRSLLLLGVVEVHQGIYRFRPHHGGVVGDYLAHPKMAIVE
jgi:hypothetical protein